LEGGARGQPPAPGEFLFQDEFPQQALMLAGHPGEGQAAHLKVVVDLVEAKVGGETIKRMVRSGSSYDSNNDMRIHFGLGAAAKIDWVQIRWPSGLTEQFDNLPVDAIHTLKEGAGTAAKPPAQP
jgi:hypothetical protein